MLHIFSNCWLQSLRGRSSRFGNVIMRSCECTDDTQKQNMHVKFLTMKGTNPHSVVL